jgi:hypothetical protein
MNKYCSSCSKIPSKSVCGACRDVLKIDLVMELQGSDVVYLSENSRCKTGRKPKLSATEQHDIYIAYNNKTATLKKLASEYKVSISTIFNIVNTSGL